MADDSGGKKSPTFSSYQKELQTSVLYVKAYLNFFQVSIMSLYDQQVTEFISLA